MCAYPCVCTSTRKSEGQRTTLTVLPPVLCTCLFHCVLRQARLLAWKLSSGPGGLVSEPQSFCCPHITSPGITSQCHHTWRLHMGSEGWIQVFMVTPSTSLSKLSPLSLKPPILIRVLPEDAADMLRKQYPFKGFAKNVLRVSYICIMCFDQNHTPSPPTAPIQPPPQHFSPTVCILFLNPPEKLSATKMCMGARLSTGAWAAYQKSHSLKTDTPPPKSHQLPALLSQGQDFMSLSPIHSGILAGLILSYRCSSCCWDFPRAVALLCPEVCLTAVLSSLWLLQSFASSSATMPERCRWDA